MLFDQLNKILKPETEAEIRRAQFVRAGAVGIFGLSVLYVTLPFFFEDDTPKTAQTQGQNDKTSIESSTHHVDLEEIWRNKVEEENQILRQEVKDQTNLLHNQMEDLMRMMKNSDFAEGGEEDVSRIQYLESRLDDMETLLDAYKEAQEQASQRGADTMDEAPEGTGAIQRFSLNLSPKNKRKKVRNVKDTIPAVSFARAVLLSGLDAPASLDAINNPIPITLRILDDAVLPNRFRGKLKDCNVLAAAHGKLSSERVSARLEKLSCVDIATGNLIETTVKGEIAGPDGKEGVRGVIAMKDGQFLGRALMGGVLGGLSNVANPQNRQAQINPFFAGNPQISAPSFGQMFTDGMATGATTGLDMYTKYNIARAEQLQPVIQVNAGQVVDILFTEAVTFEDAVTEEKRETQRNTSENTSNAQTQNVATAATQTEED